MILFCEIFCVEVEKEVFVYDEGCFLILCFNKKKGTHELAFLFMIYLFVFVLFVGGEKRLVFLFTILIIASTVPSIPNNDEFMQMS